MGFIDARMSASDKDLPVRTGIILKIRAKFNYSHLPPYCVCKYSSRKKYTK